jgi:[ribosomal protein S18]-alanine N-acetyltransferase
MPAIRPMQPADLPACARLMADNPLWQRYNVTYDSALRRLSDGLARQAGLLVAEQDGAVQGFVWVVLRGAFQRSGYIPLIGVRPGTQGRGLGAALLSAAEAIVAAGSIDAAGSTETAGADDIFLLVSDFNTRAQAFYQRQGYEQVGAIPDYVLPGVSELIFRKRLKKP